MAGNETAIRQAGNTNDSIFVFCIFIYASTYIYVCATIQLPEPN